MTSDLANAPKEFLRFFKAGKDAARAGENERAHALFRQAIEVDPYHEHVWLWLASVVATDEDRRVCFENVLELNPDNPTARRQLQKLEQRILQAALQEQPQHRRQRLPNPQPQIAKQEETKRRRRWPRRLLLLILMVAAIAAAVFAVLELGLV